MLNLHNTVEAIISCRADYRAFQVEAKRIVALWEKNEMPGSLNLQVKDKGKEYAPKAYYISAAGFEYIPIGNARHNRIKKLKDAHNAIHKAQKWVDKSLMRALARDHLEKLKAERM